MEQKLCKGLCLDNILKLLQRNNKKGTILMEKKMDQTQPILIISGSLFL